MRYYSELTRKFYDEQEECEKAEKAFKDEQEKKKAEEIRKSAERKEAAKKVEDAYNALTAAKKAYNDELSAFCEKYGSYHMTLNHKDISDWFDLIWDDLF